MSAYIGRRLLFVPFLWLAVTLVIFALLQPLGPTQRLALFVDVDPETLAHVGAEDMARIVQRYGLDDPFYVQYGRWLGEVAHGRLGWSRTARLPVIEAFRQRLPATLELALFAAIPVVLVPIWLGIYAATRRDQLPDRLTRLLTATAEAIPTFIFAILLLMIFYGRLRWFPPGRLSLEGETVLYSDTFRRITGMVTLDALLNGRPDLMVDGLRHLVLPVMTLAILGWASLTQVTRSSMLEAMGQDYVVAARAKGVPERQVINRHARRNALVPITTISVGRIINLLDGVFLVEYIFNYKGVGMFTVSATQNFDVPAVLGATLFGTTLIVLGNLAADVLYTVVDPRIRHT